MKTQLYMSNGQTIEDYRQQQVAMFKRRRFTRCGNDRPTWVEIKGVLIFMSIILTPAILVALLL